MEARGDNRSGLSSLLALRFYGGFFMTTFLAPIPGTYYCTVLCLQRKGRGNLTFAGGGAGGALRRDAVRYGARNSTYKLGVIHNTSHNLWLGFCTKHQKTFFYILKIV